jgi:3-dehydroquinate dehydratase/shikimate dehydrogenase
MESIKTKRLLLRPWKESDLLPFRTLNADERVMEFFPKTLTADESDAIAIRMQDLIEKNGYGFFAVSLLDTEEFIGFIGLNEVSFQAPFTPAVEIGWRLDFKHWGKGYATEGALAVLEFGFKTLDLDEIVSFTTMNNIRSQRVMEKIGMHHDVSDDFNHPKLPFDHPLSSHVLYRLKKDE